MVSTTFRITSGLSGSSRVFRLTVTSRGEVFSISGPVESFAPETVRFAVASTIRTLREDGRLAPL